MFAAYDTQYHLERLPLVFCGSQVDASDKQKITDNVSIFGHLVNTWQDKCTHLVCSKIVFTEKVIMALISGKPIIMPSYLEAMAQAVGEVKVQKARFERDEIIQALLPPLTTSFVPPMDESLHSLNVSLESYLPRVERKMIFKGMKFAFFKASVFRNFQKIVGAGGGTCEEIPIGHINEIINVVRKKKKKDDDDVFGDSPILSLRQTPQSTSVVQLLTPTDCKTLSDLKQYYSCCIIIFKEQDDISISGFNDDEEDEFTDIASLFQSSSSKAIGTNPDDDVVFNLKIYCGKEIFGFLLVCNYLYVIN
jgi:hypothetical protein